MQRAERASHQDKKRQKMREDLERRERGASKEQSELERAQARLKQELEMLRARQAERESTAHRERAAASAAAAVRREAAAAQQAHDARHASNSFHTQAEPPTPPGSSSSGDELLKRTVRATWSLAAHVYTEATLTAAFSKVGSVEHVQICTSKKKGKGSALVVMGSSLEAAVAAKSSIGEAHAPLQLKSLNAVNITDALNRGSSASEAMRAQPAMGRPLFPSASTARPAMHAESDQGGHQIDSSAAKSGWRETDASELQPGARASSVSSFPSSSAAHGKAADSYPSGRSAPNVPSSFPTAASAEEVSYASFPKAEFNMPTYTSAAAEHARSVPTVQPNSGDLETTSSWHAAVARNRSEELQRLSRRSELLARMHAEEGGD